MRYLDVGWPIFGAFKARALTKTFRKRMICISNIDNDLYPSIYMIVLQSTLQICPPYDCNQRPDSCGSCNPR